MTLPLWRSMLFVPATAAKFVAKAHTRAADAIIIDLEDAVASAEKARARELVADVAVSVGQSGADVLVRINRPLRMAIPDLEAGIRPEVSAVMIPKAESAEHVRLLGEVVGEIERERGMAEGQTRFVALIETPEGLLNAPAIAAAPRMVALTLGGEDFADAMGMTEVTPEAMLPFLRQVQVAARREGILALGYPGSIANFSDLDAYKADISRARALGFDGGSCIHPVQVPILNAGFGPSEAEVAQARRLVEVYDAALARGEGAVELDGRMIDVPVANRARRILDTAAKIAGR